MNGAVEGTQSDNKSPRKNQDDERDASSASKSRSHSHDSNSVKPFQESSSYATDEKSPFAQFDHLLKPKLQEMQLKEEDEQEVSITSLSTFKTKLMRSKTIQGIKKRRSCCSCQSKKDSSVKYLSDAQNK